MNDDIVENDGMDEDGMDGFEQHCTMLGNALGDVVYSAIRNALDDVDFDEIIREAAQEGTRQAVAEELEHVTKERGWLFGHLGGVELPRRKE